MVEELLHRLGIRIRHDEREAVVGTGLDRREDVGECEALVDEKLRPIHSGLTEINRRLDTIEEHYENLKGVTKEIDEICEEVRAIQKHLGIERKIAA